MLLLLLLLCSHKPFVLIFVATAKVTVNWRSVQCCCICESPERHWYPHSLRAYSYPCLFCCLFAIDGLILITAWAFVRLQKKLFCSGFRNTARFQPEKKLLCGTSWGGLTFCILQTIVLLFLFSYFLTHRACQSVTNTLVTNTYTSLNVYVSKHRNHSHNFFQLSRKTTHRS